MCHTFRINACAVTIVMLFGNYLHQVGEMKKLVEEGKVKYLGLSEASASEI